MVKLYNMCYHIQLNGYMAAVWKTLAGTNNIAIASSIKDQGF